MRALIVSKKDSNRFALLSQTLKNAGYHCQSMGSEGDLYVACSFEDLESCPDNGVVLLDLEERGESGLSPEMRLRKLSKVDYITCDKEADRLYHYGWLVQAGKVPDSTDCVSVLSQDKKPDPSLLGFLKAPSKLKSLGASYGELYERAFQKSGSKTGKWFPLDQSHSLEFIMPHDHTRKIGIRCNFNCKVSLLKDSKDIAFTESLIQDSPSKRTERLIWLAIPKSKSIPGGTKLELIIHKSRNKAGDQILCQELVEYPLTEENSLPVQLIFLSDEMSPLWRGMILAKRGLNMIRNGEWSRFSNALKRRLPEVCQRIFD